MPKTLTRTDENKTRKNSTTIKKKHKQNKNIFEITENKHPDCASENNFSCGTNRVNYFSAQVRAMILISIIIIIGTKMNIICRSNLSVGVP